MKKNKKIHKREKELRQFYVRDKVWEYQKWCEEIPYLNFKSDWEIKVIPPYEGAIVRFIVKKETAEVSIFLDCYDNLGTVDAPYWDLYPHICDWGRNVEDIFRCGINETELLINKIESSINEQLRTNK